MEELVKGPEYWDGQHSTLHPRSTYYAGIAATDLLTEMDDVDGVDNVLGDREKWILNPRWWKSRRPTKRGSCKLALVF
jgi:hypothetical protein